MSKLIYGIGFNSKRRHKTWVGGKRTLAYAAWHSMLERCYSPRCQMKRPTYIGCTVASVWHDFQDFADWFEGHKYSNCGYQLDKDLLAPNNKIYSPKTCCFVPSELNSLLINSAAARGKYPQGVHLHKSVRKYASQLKINGHKKHLGYFDCPNEAYQAYKTAKEAHVKVMALEWRDRIAPEVFDALMKWELIS